MTTRHTKTLQTLVQDFFVQHLTTERNASPNTISAYRDAIKLFLRYASDRNSTTPDRLDIGVLDVDVVRGFLDWLQRHRNCHARTRNHRLAALKSFARYVAFVAPEHLERCRMVRAVLPARFDHPEIQYLDEQEVVRLIASVDASTPRGRRDRALLLLLYNTGARVQEIVDLDVSAIGDGPIPFARLVGKGRKQRTCPLWSRTLAAVKRTLCDRGSPDGSQPLLINARRQRLSRSGIAYLLRQVQRNARMTPCHAARLSPHVMRHTTAMHLLQSGVDITTIAAWMEHAQLSTTHGYVEVDLRMKQLAIAGATALPEVCKGRYPAPNILDWLDGLGRCSGYVQPSRSFVPSPRAHRGSLHITDRGG